MNIRNITLLILSVITLLDLEAQVYVDHAATGNNDGSSWADAYTNLQVALSNTNMGEIWIAKGTYYPTQSNDIDNSFFLKNHVALIGGFLGNETSIEQRDILLHETILSGDLNNDDVPILTNEGYLGALQNTIDNSQIVVRADGVDTTAVLDGLTITGGYNRNIINLFLSGGGGLRCFSGEPRILNCRIRQNQSLTDGGGVFNFSSTQPYFYNTVIENNFALGDGGGIFNLGGHLTLEACTIRVNSTAFNTVEDVFRGGGLFIQNGSCDISNSHFYENLAYSNGGGVYSLSSTCQISNSTFGANVALFDPEGGGAIASAEEATLFVDQCNFTENYGLTGGAISTYTNAIATISNCHFFENKTQYQGSAILGASFGQTVIHACIFEENDGSGAVAFQDSNSVRISSSLFFGNVAHGLDVAGAIVGLNADSFFVQNCVFLENENTSSGDPSVFSTIRSSIEFHSCIFNNNGTFIYQFVLSELLMSHTIFEGGYNDCVSCPAGHGNVDPRFVDIDNPRGPDNVFGTIDDGIRLQMTSPAIDAGNPLIISPATDLLGIGRSNPFDIGCYEFVPCDTAVSAFCKDVEVVLDAAGSYTLTPIEIDDNSSSTCGALNYSISQSSFSCDDIGPQMVTLTVLDQNEVISDECTAIVTVSDDSTPFVPDFGNKSYALDENCAFIMPNYLDSITILDNCSNAVSINQFPVPGSVFNNPQNFTTFIYVTDAGGNESDEMTFNISLFNSPNPNAKCKDATVELNGGGFMTIQLDDIDNGSTASCGTPTFNISPPVLNCSNVGVNSVTLTVIQSGFSDNCQAQVTVLDLLGPEMNCPSQKTLDIPVNNTPFTSEDLDISGINDNCTTAQLTFLPEEYSCSSLTTQVLAFATDDYGNVSQCSISLLYNDAIPPVAICKNATVMLDSFGIASVNPADINDGSSDNCAIVSMISTPATLTCINTGLTDVILTVTDGGANTSSCTASIAVENNIRNFYVDQNADEGGHGRSWASAYTDLQSVLTSNCPINGDTIFMATGNYLPAITADQSQSHLVNHDIVILGGFSPTFGITKLSDRDIEAWPTILSGDINQNNQLDANDAHTVMEIYADAIIDGIIFEGGYADESVSGSPPGRGGGMFISSGNPQITNCIFRNNFARIGGGAYFKQANPNFKNCLFYGNEGLIESSAISASTGSNANIINCTFTENIAPADRYSIRIFNTQLNITNTIFWNNTGGDVNCYSGGMATIQNSSFNDATLPPCATDLGGNILNVDPMFSENAAQKYKPFCSPVVDLGTLDTTGLQLPMIDLSGSIRVQNGRIDIGAYESISRPQIVMNNLDEGPGSLRTIIQNACPDSTITFDLGLMHDTILLTGPQISITKNLHIQGLGMDQLFVSGNNDGNIFLIPEEVEVRLNALTLKESDILQGAILNFGVLEVGDVRVQR